MSADEDDNTFDDLPDDFNAITAGAEDNIICEINTHADHYRLCKAKAAHNAVLGEIDAPLAKKRLTANEAPHLDTKSLIAKLDEVVGPIDFDVSTILAEQTKNPVLGTVRSWIRKRTSPEHKLPRFKNQKDFYDIAKSLADF